MLKSKHILVNYILGCLVAITCVFSIYSCYKKEIWKISPSDQEKAIPAIVPIYEIIHIALKDYPFIGNIRIMEVLPNDSSGYEFLFEEDVTVQVENVPDFHKYLYEFLSNFGETPTYSIAKKWIPNVELVEENIHLIDISWEEKFNNIEPFLLIYSPLISDDGRLAIVSIDEVCFGLCSSGYTLVLSKKTKDWEKVGVIYRSFS